MLHKRIKIAVAVEQDETTFNAARGNDDIDGFAYSDSLSSRDCSA